MSIYLPVAGLSVNVFLLLGLGGGIGFLSGLLGVGGGFLLTPLLMQLGIPPAMAVGTGANHLLGSSLSGLMAHWRRGNVDVPMGVVLLIGGVFGSSVGVWAFRQLQSIGQVDLAISLIYVLVLGSIGGFMARDSVDSFVRRRTASGRRKLHVHTWAHGLPFKLRFRRSKLYISALLPLGVGFAVGLLTSIMGVGGGFVMVPAMIYLLGMPTSVVIGTSLFQVVFVAANTTFLQAWANQTVDAMLALVLLVGGVVGAQFGARFSTRVPGDWLRALLALIVLGVAAKMALDLTLTPEDRFSLELVVE